MKFSKQGFYQWLMNPVTQRDWDDAHLTNAAWDAHQDDPAFGYRFIADELNDAGLKPGENRVWRLCSQQRLWPVFAKKRGLRGKAGPPVHDDHVQRNFTANRPNQLWLTDISPPGACRGRCPTEHRTDEGKIYLCAIKDIYSNKIVGYSIDSRMKASLAVAAARNAISQRDVAGTILHSDRGSQAVFNRLKNHGIAFSMGRVGACSDNAASANSPRSSLTQSTSRSTPRETTNP